MLRNVEAVLLTPEEEHERYEHAGYEHHDSYEHEDEEDDGSFEGSDEEDMVAT